MDDFFFYFFAGLTLLCGFLVVANPFSRNPVTSAMFLLLSIVSLAGLFVLLHAFFLAAVQNLVYAGAVMVLFLFVIMLLDLKEEARRRLQTFAAAAGVLVVTALAAIAILAITQSGLGHGLTPQAEGSTPRLGHLLFENYLLPFEILSVLLLVAMVGVILFSKKELP